MGKKSYGFMNKRFKNIRLYESLDVPVVIDFTGFWFEIDEDGEDEEEHFALGFDVDDPTNEYQLWIEDFIIESDGETICSYPGDLLGQDFPDGDDTELIWYPDDIEPEGCYYISFGLSITTRGPEYKQIDSTEIVTFKLDFDNKSLSIVEDNSDEDESEINDNFMYGEFEDILIYGCKDIGIEILFCGFCIENGGETFRPCFRVKNYWGDSVDIYLNNISVSSIMNGETYESEYDFIWPSTEKEDVLVKGDWGELDCAYDYSIEFSVEIVDIAAEETIYESDTLYIDIDFDAETIDVEFDEEKVREINLMIIQKADESQGEKKRSTNEDLLAQINDLQRMINEQQKKVEQQILIDQINKQKNADLGRIKSLYKKCKEKLDEISVGARSFHKFANPLVPAVDVYRKQYFEDIGAFLVNGYMEIIKLCVKTCYDSISNEQILKNVTYLIDNDKFDEIATGGVTILLDSGLKWMQQTYAICESEYISDAKREYERDIRVNGSMNHGIITNSLLSVALYSLNAGMKEANAEINAQEKYNQKMNGVQYNTSQRVTRLWTAAFDDFISQVDVINKNLMYKLEKELFFQTDITWEQALRNAN